MPNDCANKLEFNSKDPKFVDYFIEHHFTFKDELDFNTIVRAPIDKDECPKEFIALDKSVYTKEELENKLWFDWYHWRINYWGTKWNSYDVQHSKDKYSMCITFNTAWSPAIPVVQKLIKMYPDVDFYYAWYEPGMNFAGSLSSDSPYPYDCEDYEIKDFAIDQGFEDKIYIFYGILDTSIPSSKEVYYSEEDFPSDDDALEYAEKTFGKDNFEITKYECETEDISSAFDSYKL